MDGQLPGGTRQHLVRIVQEGRREESKQKQVVKRAFSSYCFVFANDHNKYQPY
jgi:hypothetical protein